MSENEISIVNLHELAAEKMLRPLEEFIAAFEKAEISANAQDAHFNTLLHYATARNRLDIVEYLLGLGANPLITNRQNVSPFSIAIGDNKTEIADILKAAEAVQSQPASVRATLPLPEQQQEQLLHA